ncbi:hypothetical protein [Serratia marcescens]|uniref:Uncharacterized protein n=1 Tax=Serratia marcescens TaxID=615 RepID=A0A9X8VJC0_SERMA|nr:hypothetical protein [Serratia marcescens]MBS3892319.1 hypothetical protein [Serratia marcescens]
MQFKDLPEFPQTTAISAIIGACLEKGNNVKAAEEIRDALVALYDNATTQDRRNELLAKIISQLTGTKGLKIEASINFLSCHAASVDTTVTMDGKVEGATSVIVTCISKEQERNDLSEERQPQTAAHHQWNQAFAEVAARVLAPLPG